MLFNFIWRNKSHYIKNAVVMNPYDNGGLNFLDFSTLNYTFKINRLKQFIKNPFSIWNFIPNFIFSKLGGLHFVLFCNYNIEKIPTKLSNFHKQMLLSWSMIYKHNYSPQRCYIWNNRDILYKNQSLFFENWFAHDLHLLDCNGFLMLYQEFLMVYGIPIPPSEFAIVMDANPTGIVMLLRSTAGVRPTLLPLDPTESAAVGGVCFSPGTRNNNCGIRSLFQNDIVSVPFVVAKTKYRHKKHKMQH